MSQNYNIEYFSFKKNVSQDLLPIPLRCLIVGPSGCGKTNLMCNFIVNEWGGSV